MPTQGKAVPLDEQNAIRECRNCVPPMPIRRIAVKFGRAVSTVQRILANGIPTKSG